MHFVVVLKPKGQGQHLIIQQKEVTSTSLFDYN